MKKIGFIAPLLMAAGVLATPANAGAYQDSFSRCLVDSTTESDRVTLIRWIVVAYLSHPNISRLAQISPEQRNSVSIENAELFERLLLLDCHEELKKAVQFEGESSIQTSFRTLGAVAAEVLATDRDVQSFMVDFVKYVDTDRLGQSFQ